jgi:hypothetical protein
VSSRTGLYGDNTDNVNDNNNNDGDDDDNNGDNDGLCLVVPV